MHMMHNNKDNPMWLDGALYDMSPWGGPLMRCIGSFNPKVRPIGGKLPIPVVMAGNIVGHRPIGLRMYVPYLNKMTKDNLTPPYGEQEVRFLVLESDWQKLNPPEENEFGVISP